VTVDGATVDGDGVLELPDSKASAVTVTIGGKRERLDLPQGAASRHVAITVDADGAARVLDANDVQIALSSAATDCGRSLTCIAEATFGGIPTALAKRLWKEAWQSFEYWSQCIAEPTSPELRSFETGDGLTVRVVRENPLVAYVKEFATKDECERVLAMANMRELTMAHVGAGGGGTSTSYDRETLTSNLFVDWSKTTPLAWISKRWFDLASELLGEEVPYEGQEPVNFLHYLRGYEYRPHSDGGRKPGPGKRVASSLLYCEAATAGGATVFPQQPVKFQPGPRDLIFFAYNPDPRGDALHAVPLAAQLAQLPRS
jgi:hypothetical protein